MTFATKVPWKILGIEKEGAVHIGAKVLPMGWASAVGVLQHAHRRLALRSPLAGAGLLGKCGKSAEMLFSLTWKRRGHFGRCTWMMRNLNGGDESASGR